MVCFSCSQFTTLRRPDRSITGVRPEPGCRTFEIAADGLTRSSMVSIGAGAKSQSGGIGSNFLQPGYRSDVLIAFPHPGVYCMLNHAATPKERTSAGGGQGPNQTQLLATIVVTGGTPISGHLGAFVRKPLTMPTGTTPDC